MADLKISEFAAATTLGGTEEIAGVQSAANAKITPNQLRTYILPDADKGDITVSGSGSSAGLPRRRAARESSGFAASIFTGALHVRPPSCDSDS